MVVTFATSVTIACGDAAVDSVTAPELAAKPATPVAEEQYPYEWELNGTAGNAASLQIDATSYFEDGYREFVVIAQVRFGWSNEVTAALEGLLLNQRGETINGGTRGLSYQRLALPVPQGDTTLTVRVSTNNITCGLLGKGSYSGSAAFMAISSNLIQIKLSGQTIGKTTLPDVLQPACPKPPGCDEPATRVIGGTPAVLASSTSDCGSNWFPPVDGNQEFEVCYTVWRELWNYDFYTRTYSFITSWIVGVICYTTTMT